MGSSVSSLHVQQQLIHWKSMMFQIALATAAPVVLAQTPSQPHLAQAWTAMSTGDGLPGQVGKESYYYSPDGKFKAHKYEYPDAGCTKLSLHDPTQLHHIAGGERNYYMGCDSVNCCYSDFSMKKWDIEDGMLSKVNFVGYEDTTELNDNPVSGAEHWLSHSNFIIQKLALDYDYFVHRTDEGDVVSHRIQYNVSGDDDVPAGTILYGDFQVQHDLDTFKQVFTPPAKCLKANVLKCPSQQVQSWERTHFKHDYALSKARTTVV